MYKFVAAPVYVVSSDICELTEKKQNTDSEKKNNLVFISQIIRIN
jgi:hypothetical protein